MHQLILLRHAKAAPETAGLADHDRPLTELGRDAALAVGKAMAAAGLVPEVVLVSTARRTRETLEALQDAGLWEEWPNIDELPALYMATAGQIRDTLRKLPETVRSVLVIGHNPGIHDLALSLATPPAHAADLARLTASFPTASMAAFLVTTPWGKLARGAGALQRFWRPADLI